MFQTPPLHKNEAENEIWKNNEDYVIAINDELEIDIYNKGGEVLIDPENALLKEQYNTQTNQKKISYLVDLQGSVKLPMVGDVNIAGMTLRQAEEVLEQKYANYYDRLYVRMQFLNKRVFVLGAAGGHVIPVPYGSASLSEILSGAGGLDVNAKAHNIRLVRGKEVWVADFSTMEGFINTDMLVQPNDIIYIEPVRRPFVESFRDYGPVLGIVANIISVTALIISINSK